MPPVPFEPINPASPMSMHEPGSNTYFADTQSNDDPTPPLPEAARFDGSLVLIAGAPTTVEPEPIPHRIQSPFYPHHPHVVDSSSLQAAVQQNPEYIWQAICKLVHERDIAQAQLMSVSQDYEGARQDHKSVQETWNHLFKIEKGKQVLLWKFIDRLQRAQVITGHGNDCSDQGNLSNHLGIDRNARLNQALNQALYHVEGFPSSPVTIQTGSDDSSSLGSIEWRVGGSLDPAAVSTFNFPALSYSAFGTTFVADGKSKPSYQWHL